MKRLRVQLSVGALTALSFMQANAACRSGEASTPADVIKKYAPGGTVPAGKSACRLNGDVIVVPAISREARNNDPPCGPDVVVKDSALGDYKAALAAIGSAGMKSGNPWGIAGGAVVSVVVAIDPQVAHNATANCGIASVLLPPSIVPFHHYILMRYDSHMKDAFVIDQDSFDRPGAGEPFQKATWMPPITTANGNWLYGATYKNWATGSGNYRHVVLVLDVFE